ncbi:MAG: prolyl oligopeptidase family serine peptidase, partial [Steroidobacteraceae bacterium]
MSRRNAASFPFLFFFLWVCGLAGASEAPAPVQRDLWSRNDLRYERRWLVLGAIDGDLSKDPIAATGGEAAMSPAAGAAELLKGGKSLTWQSASSWSDEFTLTWPTGTPEFRGSQAAAQVAYAFAKIVRDSDADVDVLFASTGPVHIWFNGGSDRSAGAYRRLAFDQDRMRIHLRRGENTILIKSEHKSGPWSFALRIVAQGTVLPRPALAPAIASISATSLTVSPDVGRQDRLPPVEVSIIAAGGRVIAHSTVLRGQDARFETGTWRDGAYEIRLQTPLPWNETETRHLDWYKGNAQAAADRVLAAAKAAPAGVEGDSIRMLADLIGERVGGSLNDAADDGWSRIASPLMEYEELLLDRAGKQGSVRPYGFVRLAYEDEVDGSTQFCRAYLPPDYAASHASPLVIFLHGYNPPNPRYVGWWSAADRHNDIADHRKVIYVEPHARGNTQYVGIGEQDVLRCLEEAKRRFKVDANRVYLTGESMGGSGTWIIGSNHPELFAAIAPTYGGWDYRL